MPLKSLAPVFVILFCFISVGSAQDIITFRKTFGDSRHDFGHSVQQTTDGGFILFGLTTNDSIFNYDLYLIKTDFKGEKQWEKKFGDESFQVGSCVQQTTDGGYILCGADNGYGNDSLTLIKTDASGNPQWKHKYRMSVDRTVGRYVQQTQDGGFIIAGYMGDAPSSFAYIIKTDATGTLEWSKSYGGGKEIATCIQQTGDSGYLVIGQTGSYGHGSIDMYVLRLNSLGDTLWTKTYGTEDYEHGFSLDITSDGGFVALGYNNNRNGDLYLVKADEFGNELWTKSYGGDSQDDGHSVEQTTDGGYFLAGRKSNGSNQPVDMYVVKTDPEGEVIWDAVYPQGLISEASSAQQTSDGGYIILGSTTSIIDQTSTSDMYLVKIDSVGNTSGIISPAQDIAITICPNPFFETVYIKFDQPLGVLYNLLLYDALGKEIRDESGELYQEIEINRGDLSAGMYFFTILSGGKVIGKGKIIAI
ncbi:MAG TPA: T9SS type A sorting domain-containing protein [Saprospiraceae bacterium]|nr:T9SS type A sorting domain-containing protein [Saprospiraceae bacterium]